MTGPLHSDTILGVRLSAICTRHQFTTEPRAAIDELLATAGGRGDILAREVGTWAGFHEVDEECQPLVRALLGIPGARAWAGVGRARRNAGGHKIIAP
jgi:hypothetical protein